MDSLQEQGGDSFLAFRPALGPTHLISNRCRGLFLGGKATGAWKWPHISNSVEVQNVWSYTSIPQYVLTAWNLIKQWMRFVARYVKHRDNFYLELQLMEL
jgi:hypothetical protein